MVERRLSTDREARERYQKVGVVVFILNELGEVLVVRENSANLDTGKRVGEYGVICETSNGGETWEETVIRGLGQELGIEPDQVSTFFRVSPDESFLGESPFVDGVLARVVAIRWVGQADFTSFSGDGEVSIVGWEKPGNLPFYRLRAGVRKILGECLEGRVLARTGSIPQENLLPLSVDSLRQAAGAAAAPQA